MLAIACVTLKLTCDSAGAHLGVRLAWRRHCRAGAAKDRAASIVIVCIGAYVPIGATGRVVAVRGGGAGQKRARCAKLGGRKSKLGRGHRLPSPHPSVFIPVGSSLFHTCAQDVSDGFPCCYRCLEQYYCLPQISSTSISLALSRFNSCQAYCHMHARTDPTLTRELWLLSCNTYSS